MKIFRLRQGFTLVEVLVVISIIAVLMGVTAVSYVTAQQKGRDAKRKSDINLAQKGFEQYFLEFGNYGFNAACNTININTTYFPAGLPRDPKNTSPYVYAYACNTSTGGGASAGSAATQYCNCALLETLDSGNSTSAVCDYAAQSASAQLDYYCISNVQ